ncbi:50S ribosomal protein L11 methyltransferase [Bacteroidota bacterium]
MQNHKKFVISLKPFAADLVSGLLWELDIEGISESDNYLEVFALDTSDVRIEDISRILNKFVEENILESYDVEESVVESKNWNEEWEKSINIVHISDKIVIVPSFKNYTPEKNQIIITIDPKMSFGTGEHQTTKLVLSLCEKYVKPGDKVLDVGSGTGVLAIGAVKFGAGSALGIDNDEWCELNGSENIELNKVHDKVEIRLAEIDDIDETGFDLVLANINKHILLSINEKLKQKIKPGGRLILSGLLADDEEDIKKSYQPTGFKLLEKTKLDEWIALVYQAN